MWYSLLPFYQCTYLAYPYGVGLGNDLCGVPLWWSLLRLLVDSKHWPVHHSVHSPSMPRVSLGGRIRAVLQVNHHGPVLSP